MNLILFPVIRMTSFFSLVYVTTLMLRSPSVMSPLTLQPCHFLYWPVCCFLLGDTGRVARQKKSLCQRLYQIRRSLNRKQEATAKLSPESHVVISSCCSVSLIKIQTRGARPIKTTDPDIFIFPPQWFIRHTASERSLVRSWKGMQIPLGLR